MYDVIIIGGGPGGSTAAAISAKSGLRTLLIDREGFPREKACGDAVSGECIAHLRRLGMGPFDPVEFYDSDKVLIQGPKGANLTLKISKYENMSATVVSRYVFDAIIHDFAIKNGAEDCQMSVTGPLVEDGQVVGVKAKAGKQQMEYRSKVVIAADGATSVFARALKSYDRPDSMSAVALRGYINTDQDLGRLIEFVFLDEVQPGYAWFFPTGNRRANIGVGMRSDQYKKQDKTLNDAMNYYLRTMKDRIGAHQLEDVRSWQIPLFAHEQKRTFDGAMLVGDAGGFVDPLTGAGIYAAIRTGIWAAEAADQAIKANDLTVNGLAHYDKMWKAEIAPKMRRSMQMHKLFAAIPSSMDALINIAHVIPPLVPALLGKV